MKLSVFGASGGVGKEIVKQAVAAGHSVRAVYRKEPHATLPGVEVKIVPNFLDAQAVKEAIGDADAILGAVGLRRKSPSNPWSMLTTASDFTSKFAECLVKSVQGKRVIAVSAGGVADSWSKVALPLRLLFGHSNIGIAYEDLARMEDVFRKSDLNWTCVRPTTLTNGKLTQKTRETEHYGLFSRISRADVAWFMLEALQTKRGSTPMITG